MKNSNTILDYIFKRLRPYEEAQFEMSLSSDDHLNEVVNGVIKFCLDFDLTTKEAFYTEWEKIIEKAHVPQFPVTKVAVPKAGEAEPTIDEKLTAAYCKGNKNSVEELVAWYDRDKELDLIIRLYKNNYDRNNLLIDLHQHFKKMQNSLSPDDRKKIFIYDWGKVDVKRTFCDFFIDLKYCEGDKEAISIIDSRYGTFIYFIVYNFLRKFGVNKNDAAEQAYNIKASIYIKLIKKPVYKRNTVFRHADSQINVMRTLFTWIINECIDYLRKKRMWLDKFSDDMYYLPSQEKNYYEESKPFQLIDVKWPEAKFLDDDDKKRLDQKDMYRKLAVRILRKNGRLRDKDEYMICCYYNLDYTHKLILSKTGRTDSENVSKIIYNIEHRYILREILNIKGDMKRNGGKLTKELIKIIHDKI